MNKTILPALNIAMIVTYLGLSISINNHYYAPFPGQKSAADFIKFYHSPKTLFCKDIPNLYK